MFSCLLRITIILQVDVIEEEEKLQQDARAVLGAADDDHCSYPDVRVGVGVGVRVLVRVRVSMLSRSSKVD